MKRRSKFSLSHYKLLSCKMGQLVPIGLTEVLPGDTIQQSTSVFIRFSPMVAPVMHPVHVKIHHWYVPFRLIWDDFEDFITGGPDGLNDSVPPYLSRTSGNTYRVGTLADYLGVPSVAPGASLDFSSLPFRAYQLIWNEWYRDQNLQSELNIPKTSGADHASSPMLGYLQYSSWGKDYFTTATPWEQKGIAVQVPVNGDPQGTITISGAPGFTGGGSFTYDNGESSDFQSVVSFDGSGSSITLSGSANVDRSVTVTKGTLAAAFDGTGSLGNIDLNQLREAFALQRFEEHRALYGSRYVEYLRYLGIKASDARLQRPEYLGGGRSTIQFSEVLQTAEGSDPVGTMRGHGIGAIRTNRYRRFIEEHGLIMTLMTIRPISVYTQGLPRMFSRRTKEDFWQKELEHIGQQEIMNSEVYVGSSDPTGTFGFTDRYDEYRSHESSVAGEFRTTLNYWHFGREFESEPVLNGDFISSAPTNRPFADQTGSDTLYVMANHSIQARRIISRKGTPI